MMKNIFDFRKSTYSDDAFIQMHDFHKAPALIPYPVPGRDGLVLNLSRFGGVAQQTGIVQLKQASVSG